MTPELTLQDLKDRLVAYTEDICTIPEEFPVNPRYLCGLSRGEFNKTFAQYRDLLVSMYRQAAQNPAAYGFTSTDRKTGVEKLHPDFVSTLTFREKLVQVHHLLNKLVAASTLTDDTLVVDMPELRELMKALPKVRDADKLLMRLQEQGFAISGYTGKLSKTLELSISFPRNPSLIQVVRSYAQSKYAKHGMEYDYAHMNYRLLALSPDDSLALTDLFVYRSLCREAQVFLLEFNAAMNSEGFSYGDAPTSGFCWGRSQFAYSKAPEKRKDYVCRLYQRDDTLVVRLFLRRVEGYASYIEQAPSLIREPFTNDFGKCNACKPVCGHRKTYTISGTTYEKCDGVTFEFHDLSHGSIPYYIELLRLSARANQGRVFANQRDTVAQKPMMR